MVDFERLFNEVLMPEEIIALRRELHMNPEISGSEFETAERICKYLDHYGIEYRRCVGNNGIVAIVRGNVIHNLKDGPAANESIKTVGLRGDMDALPIEEMSDVPYRSKRKGVMHACGHDVHTAILLSTAILLKSMENQLEGNVKFFFQPNEEDTGGAEQMIQEGCLLSPNVDYVLGLHVSSAYKSGQIGIKYGKMYATSDMIELRVYGKSCHGAQPDKGIDAIVVAANIINCIQTVVSRNTSPTNSAVCTFGTIKGGNVRNQVADYVELSGIIRTLDPETRLKTRELVRNICESVAQGMGAKAELKVTESYKPLINDDSVTDIVRKNAMELVGMENVIIESEPQLGVEDFSYFAAERPACFIHLGSNNETMDYPPVHNSKFDVDESCLITGIKLQIENVFSLLRKETKND